MGFNARGNSWTAASRKARLYCAQPVASKPHRSQSCELRDLGCHAIATSCLYQRHCHSVKELKGRLIDDWCMRSWTVDFWRGYWPVARKTSSMCPYILKKETSSTAWQCTDNVAWGCDMERGPWTPNHLVGGHNAFGPQYLAFEIHVLANKWVIWYSSWPACRELPASPVQKLYTNSTFISRNSSILRPLTRTLTCKLPYRCIWRFFEWHSLSPSHWLLRDTGHTRPRSRRTTTTLVTVSACPMLFTCVWRECVSVCVTLSVNSPTGQTPQRIFAVDSLKDADLCKDVPFGGLDDE